MSTSLRAGDFRATEGDEGLFSMVFNPAGSTTTTPVVSTTPTVTVDPAKAAFDAATSDITNLYQTLLRRSPDKPGLDWWASVVSSGNATLQDVANQFRNSAEYKVVTAYNDVLGRYPEQAGLDWWVKQATDQNLTVDQLKNELGNTIEAKIINTGSDAKALQQLAKDYGLTPQDIAKAKNTTVESVQQFFRDSGIPLGTLLTGTVQRQIGTEGGIRQLDKGEDVVTEKALGVQNGKILVQQYDAYGFPTSTRLTEPNTPEGQGWLQALGIVGAAVGLSNLFDAAAGAAAGTGAGSTAVAGVEGAISQAATTAQS